MPYPKLPMSRRAMHQATPWVFTGAAMLAGTAGFVNTCLLSFFNVPVSHMSGAVSRLGIDLEAANFSDFVPIISIVLGFLGGAFVSGLIIGRRVLSPGRRYGVALMIEGGLLLSSALLLGAGSGAGVPLAAMACGIQNAMASSYYGLIIRTTHVTGIVTDLGVMLGHLVRHRHIRTWQISLLAVILFAFLAGSFSGALALGWLGLAALHLPASGCLVTGGSYYLWRLHKERKA